MTAKEKALEIIESFRDGVLALTLFNDKEVLVKCAIIHVKWIISECWRENSEREKYWREVLHELNQM